ncbi:MAG: hypothetical protein WKF84_13985 [Pyrinomonadaceae bacterium]
MPVTGVSADSVIGVTLWRLRSPRPTDAGERIIVQEGPEATEWLPERVSFGGRLSEGDRIRVSIEAARTGYLYVVDQEVYADGSKGRALFDLSDHSHARRRQLGEGRSGHRDSFSR